MLIITNGDAAAAAIRDAGIAADILPWREVLHDGPVPAGLSLEELSDLRARYLASCGWGKYEAIRQELRARDDILARAANYPEVVLWFEHDLYDQLQLIQAATLLADEGGARVSLVPQATFITHLRPEDLRAAFANRGPLLDRQVLSARRAWHAFTAPTPEGWLELAHRTADGLPDLPAAFARLLEELPGPDGLSRTERTALGSVAERPGITPGKLFRAVHESEEAAFMGDASFWLRLLSLAADPPLIAPTDGSGLDRAGAELSSHSLAAPLEITTAGSAVLAGGTDRLATVPADKWLGGTHLRPGHAWRWDAEARQLLKPY